MQEDDIQILQRISAKEKIRYDEMDVKYEGLISGTNCYVCINFSQLLIDLDSFREGIVDEKDFIMHAAIELINVYAHYKHYFQTRDANHVILIGYVRDKRTYEKYKELLDAVYEMTTYFPNIYLIPDINNKYTPTVHIVESILINMQKTMGTVKNKFSSIYLVSCTGIDKQLLCAFPTRAAFAMYKGYGFSNTVFLSKEEYLIKIVRNKENYDNFKHKAELEYMSVFLGKYFNTVRLKMPKIDNIKITYKHSRVIDKENILNDFIENVYDPTKMIGISQQFLMYLKGKSEITTSEGINALTFYEQCFDYRYQNVGSLNEITMIIFKTWKQKIKDYAIARESENYKTLLEHLMYSNWLLA